MSETPVPREPTGHGGPTMWLSTPRRAWHLTILALALLSAPPLAIAQSARESRGQVLNFTASWCPGCQVVAPTVSRLQREGLPIQKVDVDSNRDLSKQMRIGTIPAFVLIVDGKVVQKEERVMTEADLRRMLARIPKKSPVILAQNGSEPTARPTQSQPGSGRTDASLGTAGSFDAEFVRTADSTVASSEPAAPPFDSGRGNPRRHMNEVKSESGPIHETKGTLDALAGVDDLAALELLSSSQPFEASVRIRIKESDGVTLGSGTVIDSRSGAAIILTCAHIFRDMKPTDKINVDLFLGNETVTVVGRVIRYDMEADVGLLSVQCNRVLPTAMLAGSETPLNSRDEVTCVGCSAGKDPTRMNLQITNLNRYKGPENIECTGLPVQGRSGGGLFNQRRQVIGVCIAADEKENRGLYAGLGAIHDLLDASGLGRLYRPIESSNGTTSDALTANEGAVPATGGQPVTMTRADEAAVEQLRSSGSSEVICIIRSKNDPRASSRVVVLENASDQFVNYLETELRAKPQPTAGHVPHAATTPRPLRSVEEIRKARHSGETTQGWAAVPTESLEKPAPYRRYR